MTEQPSLLWQPAYENASKDCRAIIATLWTTTKDISEPIKACQDASTEQHKASLLVAAIKGDPRCYNCGKPGHLRRDCLATSKRGKGKDKLLPGDCPRCGKGRHWARECRSKFDKSGQPIQGNLQGAPAPAPPTPIRAFRTAINIRGCREIQFPTFIQPPTWAQGWIWSPPANSS